MGIRLTGISTPVGGLSQEYTHAKEQKAPTTIVPRQKIKVFISSICGVEKYEKVRAELKNAIESTQLADVYTFEGEGASTLPAGAHYTYALKDSDICIFLIDNADGIKAGVQAEIDTVNKHNIKALYYFCDETQKEKTALEQSMMGARFAKSKTIHSFDELSKDGAQALINDIIAVYHYYCTGRIVLKSDETDEIQNVDVVGTEQYQLPTIPKTALKNVDKCRNYLLEFVLGYPRGKYPDEQEKTSEYDEWGLQFLPVLFEGKSIKHFNTGMYLDVLKEVQDASYYNVVQSRWQAIQAYFSGDLDKCITLLDTALSQAKESGQPAWIVKDILIDQRNVHWTNCTAKNQYYDAPAQKELLESSEELYYPILDRIHGSIAEKYFDGFYKKKTESPYTVTLGSNLDSYGEMLASSLVVSMYNGSLTHILLLHNKVKDLAFYLSSKYDDWNFKLTLFKLVIFSGKSKEIKGIQDSFPEVLNKLTAEEAESIMEFCLNHPIWHQRLSSQLLAFGAVGYFLNDKDFELHEKSLIGEIKTWLQNDNVVVAIGQNIFKALSEVSHRISQDTLAEICCQFINRHYSRWYTDMFRFIAKHIKLQKMSIESAQALVQHINNLFDNEDERWHITSAPAFLCILRNQNRELTDTMDKKVAEYYPDYYKGEYKLETALNEEQDTLVFVQECIERICRNNEEQGKNGVYVDYAVRQIATARAILLEKNTACNPETMDKLISAVSNTLLYSKENISIKLDAITLLISIVLKYPEDYIRNRSAFDLIYEQQNNINVTDHSAFSFNVDGISLKIGLCFLYAAMGKNVYGDVLELMPYIRDDIPTTIAVSRLVVDYLETTDTVILPPMVESIVLQNVLQWLHSENTTIRWNATRILLTLSRNPENQSIVNRQLVSLVDSDNVYIKNLIMRQLHGIGGITDKTKNHIVSKCKHDANYVVRTVCSEVETEKQA